MTRAGTSDCRVRPDEPLASVPVSGPVVQPADLQDVRASYDRVADDYVAMGVGDLAPAPWLRAVLGALRGHR